MHRTLRCVCRPYGECLPLRTLLRRTRFAAFAALAVDAYHYALFCTGRASLRPPPLRWLTTARSFAQDALRCPYSGCLPCPLFCTIRASLRSPPLQWMTTTTYSFAQDALRCVRRPCGGCLPLSTLLHRTRFAAFTALAVDAFTSHSFVQERQYPHSFAQERVLRCVCCPSARRQSAQRIELAQSSSLQVTTSTASPKHHRRRPRLHTGTRSPLRSLPLRRMPYSRGHHNPRPPVTTRMRAVLPPPTTTRHFAWERVPRCICCPCGGSSSLRSGSSLPDPSLLVSGASVV